MHCKVLIDQEQQKKDEICKPLVFLKFPANNPICAGGPKPSDEKQPEKKDPIKNEKRPREEKIPGCFNTTPRLATLGNYRPRRAWSHPPNLLAPSDEALKAFFASRLPPAVKFTPAALSALQKYVKLPLFIQRQYLLFCSQRLSLRLRGCI